MTALQVIYDIMVCAVGEMTATFGVPGVMEHCYFMKVNPERLQSCRPDALLCHTFQEDSEKYD